MASAEHLKALLKSHIEGDEDRFFSVAMQLAAHEARLGHGKLAEEIRNLLDEAKSKPRVPSKSDKAVPISKPRGELAGLLSVSYPKSTLSQMVLEADLLRQIKRVIREQRRASEILAHGLSPRRKLLLVGPPGTGKTLTASVLAGELGLPLFEVKLDGLITKFMGETAAKLRQVFEATDRTRGVYFFDEFDAIGSQRGTANDVGEARRILNSFLQMIEQDNSHSLIIAATNHAEILDYALLRRFDDVLHYEAPNVEQIESVLTNRLQAVASADMDWKKVATEAQGLSYAEITRIAEEVLKEALIEKRSRANAIDVLRMIGERKLAATRLNRHK